MSPQLRLILVQAPAAFPSLVKVEPPRIDDDEEAMLESLQEGTLNPHLVVGRRKLRDLTVA